MSSCYCDSRLDCYIVEEEADLVLSSGNKTFKEQTTLAFI